MENFIVSARKYRPQEFSEVVGQQHVTNTLKNAIEQNHLAQALLFTGPRGVGKTTCARILAKMINQQDGETAEDQDFAFNIFELDAASNNSVDDIRSLTEQVRYAPQAGNYKVYIIDEVHMLSTAAFNAFLKTLEEPPAHAIFILATTEKHKIIPTILSRCQIFDFKRITVEDIAAHLKEVAEKEGVEAESEALHIIAQKADGALRDALSIFDRIVSFSGNQISYQDVIENLRILDYEYYFKTTDAILQNNQSDLLLIFDEILDNGFDGHLYINGLASHFRDLLVCQDARTLELLEVGEQTRERYKVQAQHTDAAFLLKGLRYLNETDYQYKASNNPRLLVESCLLQLGAMAGKPAAEKKRPDVKDIPLRKPSGLEVPKAQTESAPKVAEEKKAEIAPEKKVEVIENKSVNQVSEENIPIKKEAPPTKQENLPDPHPAVPPSDIPKKERTRRRSKLSINSALENSDHDESPATEETDPNAPEAGKPKDEFSEKELQDLWKESLQNLKDSGKKIEFNSLENSPISLQENYEMELKLPSNAAKDFFDKEKTNILQFLRKKLNNFSITVNVIIEESKEVKNPYTPQEKFDYLAKKNPYLKTMKERLNLDVE